MNTWLLLPEMAVEGRTFPDFPDIPTSRLHDHLTYDGHKLHPLAFFFSLLFALLTPTLPD